jgi:hypothetical protein
LDSSHILVHQILYQHTFQPKYLLQTNSSYSSRHHFLLGRTNSESKNHCAYSWSDYVYLTWKMCYLSWPNMQVICYITNREHELRHLWKTHICFCCPLHPVSKRHTSAFSIPNVLIFFRCNTWINLSQNPRFLSIWFNAYHKKTLPFLHTRGELPMLHTCFIFEVKNMWNFTYASLTCLQYAVLTHRCNTLPWNVLYNTVLIGFVLLV